MVGKSNHKCVKCGVTSQENPTLTFHRFPQPSVHGSLKAKVWAKFCFPSEDWASASDDALVKLYKQHKMLCGNHFDDSSFTSGDRKRLNKFAIPTEARNILAELRGKIVSPHEPGDTLKAQMEAESAPSTSQHSSAQPLVDSPQSPKRTKMEAESAPSTSQHSSAQPLVDSPQSPKRTIMEAESAPSTSQHSSAQPLVDSPQSPKRTIMEAESAPSTSQHSSAQALVDNRQSRKRTKMEAESAPSTSQHSSAQPLVDSPQSPKRTKETCRRKGILKELGLKKLELTPKKQKLYKRCRQNITEILRLRRKLKKVKRNKRDILHSLQSDNAVNDIMKSKVSSSFYLLLQSQLQNTSRKLTGRRWTLDDKVLALSLYKKSSSCYRLLKRLFCLPSISSLKALLNKIPMKCGINKQVMETIKEITTRRSIEHNLCILAFDEMSIRKNLSYDSKLDQIEGYQDHGGQGRTNEIASKALTFMAIGVRKKWKQPIAFYFSGAYVTADRLSVLIKEVLSACFAAGLEVIGVVCDCDGVNLRAVNTLGSSTQRPYFDHEGHEIATILDPPHLLKCFRNNFLKHNIQFTQDVQLDGRQSTGEAKWAHIEELYNLEKTNRNFVFAPALTPQHLQPNGKQKMKVKLAAQVLSHSVAAGLYAKVAQNELPPDASATATVVSNMDKLFDAMNGDTPDRKRGKPLLTNMSSTSSHMEFFQKMKKFFCDMKFVGARVKPPSQEGWVRTLNAMERVYYNLKKYNINTISLRRLNQDPLENCFGSIRMNCGSNPNPTTVQFVAALKASVITNLTNINKNRNCLDDQNDVLDNFKVFLCKGTQTGPNKADNSTGIETPEYNIDETDIPQSSGEIQACAYVCGFISKKIDSNCPACRRILMTDQNTEVYHLFTSFKEYSEEKTSLKYVQPSFCRCVEMLATLTNDFLKENSSRGNIKSSLLKKCEQINFKWLEGCRKHMDENKKNIIYSTIAICIKRFCVLKNRQFVEDASTQSLVRKIKILKHI